MYDVNLHARICYVHTCMYVGETMCTDDCVNDMQYWYDNEHNC